MAEYKHHLILIVVVLLLLSNYTTTTTTTTVLGLWDQLNSTQKQKLVVFLSNYTKAQGLEERLDQEAKRSLVLAALAPDPSSFYHLIRIYYGNRYIIHPETKNLVLIDVYAYPQIQVYTRCRRCRRPAPITEADWRRYEAAVKRPPGLWITEYDVSKCREWLKHTEP